MRSRVTPLLVAVVVLLGAAILVTAWTTYEGVRAASATLERGQADAFVEAVRSRLAELDGPPTPEALQAILEDERPAGLRWIAILEERRFVIEAGTPVGGALGRHEPGEPVHVGDRVRTFVRPQGLRRVGLAIEFEPRQAEALRAAAGRTLGIGALTATTLLVVGGGLVRVALRRAALERQRERERRLASLGEMSAVLAHEIRNPLASLKGNAQLLAAVLPAGEKPRQKADRVVDEAIRLEALTNDLLEFVRTGSLERAAADPAALLREAAASVDPGITVDASGAPASWRFDRDRVREVLVNLLDNAVQAGPPVITTVRAAGKQLVFEVADRGPGVPPDEQERIFEPFFTKRTHGTGLGLAIARRVVELHGGTIAVTNGPEGGAIFRVVLPA